jgi:hypothetical protein
MLVRKMLTCTLVLRTLVYSMLKHLSEIKHAHTLMSQTITQITHTHTHTHTHKQELTPARLLGVAGVIDSSRRLDKRVRGSQGRWPV